MLERSTNIPWRDGKVVPLPKDPAVSIRGGAIVCADASGLAVPGRADPGLAFVGVAECEAVSGERAVLTRRNVDLSLRSVAGAGAVTAVRIGRPCWIVDDEFVAASDGVGARPVAGIVTGVEGERVWVRGESAASASIAAPGAAGIRRIHSGVRTGTGNDRAGSPLDGADDSLVLPSAPDFMLVRAGWRLYSGSSVRTQGYSEALYIEGDTHVRAHFGNTNWSEFDNIGVLSDTVLTVSIGVLADNYRYDNAFTLEYAPATQTVSFAPANDPASSLVPVVHSLIIAGS